MKYLFYLSLALLIACNKNPYPENGVISVQQPAEPEEVRPAISVDLPDNVEFREGAESSFSFRAVVPRPGTPVVSFEKLPDGVTFDLSTLTLTWNPGYSIGNSPTDPQVKVMIYPIVIWVRSSDDDIQAVRKTMNLVVHDSPRPIQINSESTFEAFEGVEGKFNFSIVNTDYPQGPYDVSLGDFPINTDLVKVNSNEFLVKMNPDYQHVHVKEDTRCFSSQGSCREYKARLSVINPAGHKFEKKVTIKIIDRRLAPKVIATEKMEQGLDVNFQLGAYDLNSEISPRIELTSRRPQAGKFSFDVVQNESTFSSMGRISWTDLPPSMNGTTQTFSFRVCTLSDSSSYQNCVNQTVSVAIKIRERLAPSIERNIWPIGEMKYLSFNEVAEFKLDVFDAHDRQLTPVVEIFPESIRKFVSWNRGVLKLKFNESGIFQFNVVATSQYGVKSIEGFVVEIFPATRGKVLLLSDSSRDKEVKFYRKHFSSLDIVNPFIQELGVRLLSGRSTVVVGTSVLQDPESKSQIQKAVDMIKNIVIASPLIYNLPDTLYRQITDDFRISIVGRFSDIPRLPGLNELQFVTRQDFAVPKFPLVLSGNTTVESMNPMIFSTGVDTSNCDDVLEISDALRLNRLKIGIICDRPRSGRLAILGTEWADLNNKGPMDEMIPSKWLDTMLSAKLNTNEEVP